MIWKLTVRQRVPGYWGFVLREGRKVLRRGNAYTSREAASYAAGIATAAEMNSREPMLPLEIIKDFGGIEK